MAKTRPKPPDTSAPITDPTGRITGPWYKFLLQLWSDATTSSVAIEDGTAGASELNDLDDVTVTSPANGEVLTYDSGSSTWQNAASGGSGGGWTAHPDNPKTPTAAQTVEFNSLPSGTVRIRLVFDDITADTNNAELAVQLGTSGGWVTSGYNSAFVAVNNFEISASIFFLIAQDMDTGGTSQGIVDLERVSDSHEWVYRATSTQNSEVPRVGVGRVALGAELTRLRYTCQSGINFAAQGKLLVYTES